VDQVALRLCNFDHIARRDWPHSLWGKPLVYKIAAFAYRWLHEAVAVAMALLKLPVGVVIGVRWDALVAAMARSDSHSVQVLVNWLGTAAHHLRAFLSRAKGIALRIVQRRP
jgi:hypothetical protein